MEALFQGMDGMISSKTVVGDAIHVGDTIILPLVDVSFGIGAGSFRAEKREKEWVERWKDYPECSSCDQEWNDQACKCEKSGYNDKNFWIWYRIWWTVLQRKGDKVTEQM